MRQGAGDSSGGSQASSDPAEPQRMPVGRTREPWRRASHPKTSWGIWFGSISLSFYKKSKLILFTGMHINDEDRKIYIMQICTKSKMMSTVTTACRAWWLPAHGGDCSYSWACVTECSGWTVMCLGFTFKWSRMKCIYVHTSIKINQMWRQ